MGVIVPIVTSILFGILFPTGDITLDIKFMERALTFNVGKTLELLGCKLCYKNEDLVYERKDKNCSTCLVNDYDNRCGVIQTFVDKIIPHPSTNVYPGSNFGIVIVLLLLVVIVRCFILKMSTFHSGV